MRIKKQTQAQNNTIRLKSVCMQQVQKKDNLKKLKTKALQE